MTQQSEYAKALDTIPNNADAIWAWYWTYQDTIHRALRLADALEPLCHSMAEALNNCHQEMAGWVITDPVQGKIIKQAKQALTQYNAQFKKGDQLTDKGNKACDFLEKKREADNCTHEWVGGGSDSFLRIRCTKCGAPHRNNFSSYDASQKGDVHD